jgi:hypothetical protein
MIPHPDIAPRGFPLRSPSNSAAVRLTRDGLFVIADVRASRLFVCALELASGRCVRRDSAAIPAAFGPIGSVQVDSRDLWLIDWSGRLAQIDLESLALRRTRDLRELVEPGARFADAELIPDSRYLWMLSELDTGYDTAVVDVRRWRRVRELGDLDSYSCVDGTRSRICAAQFGDIAQVFYPSGSVAGPPLDAVFLLKGAANHPDGRSLVVVQPDDRDQLAAAVCDVRGRLGPELAIDGTHVDQGCIMASSLDAGLVFAAVEGERRTELVALRPAGDRLELVYRAEVPHRAMLVTDVRSRRVAAVAEVDAGVQAIELGPEPPRFGPTNAAVPVPWPFDRLPFRLCGLARDDARVRELRAARRWDRARLDAYVAEHLGDPDALLALYRALFPGADDRVDRLLEVAAAEHPDHPGIAVAVADHPIAAKRWPEIAAALEGVEPIGPERQHHLHILGIAQLECGMVDAARTTLRRAAAIPGPCDVAPHLGLVDPDTGGVVAQLLAAIRGADERLAAGDPAGALAALDRPGVWAAGELHHLVRCAEALLQLDENDEFDKAHCLAMFCDAFATPLRRRELPVPGDTWDADRLAGLAVRARRWLEDLGS